MTNPYWGSALVARLSPLRLSMLRLMIPTIGEGCR